MTAKTDVYSCRVSHWQDGRVGIRIKAGVSKCSEACKDDASLWQWMS